MADSAMPCCHFGHLLVSMGVAVQVAAHRESCNALGVIGTAPFANRDRANAEALGDHHLGLSFGAGQNDLRTLHHTVPQCAGMGAGSQFLLLSLSKTDGDWRGTAA
ncbi:MAG: hypothetical protein OXG70_02315 [Cyanobacteria bacterium MAG IRC1_bin_28]|nr:hypothetical protein [Cyanobacteria bacterium MAG IRC1_bin_28]